MDAPRDQEIREHDALRANQCSPIHNFFTDTDDHSSGEILPVNELSQSSNMWDPWWNPR